jgi:hypothetical protein
VSGLSIQLLGGGNSGSVQPIAHYPARNSHRCPYGLRRSPTVWDRYAQEVREVPKENAHSPCAELRKLRVIVTQIRIAPFCFLRFLLTLGKSENALFVAACVKEGAKCVESSACRPCGYFNKPNCFSTKGKNSDGRRSRACDKLNKALSEGLFSPLSNWPM